VKYEWYQTKQQQILTEVDEAYTTLKM